MLVVIGLPHFDGRMVSELGKFILEAGRYYLPTSSPSHPDIDLKVVTSIAVDVARNQLAAYAKRTNARILWMLDHDAIPSAGTFAVLTDLLLAQVIPSVISAPHSLAGGGVCPPGCMQSTAIERVKPGTPTVSTHTIAIDVKVFDRLAPPYFKFTTDDKNQEWLGGEDAYFIDKCHAAQVPVFLAGSHWSDHVKQTRLGRPRVLTNF